MSGGKVVLLSGGVGGAKLALGLYREIAPERLSIVVNTGDDFDHLGLRVCPDIDTTLYTLADLEQPQQGWGRRDETWTFMKVLADLGAETWFQLGDGDVALHVERTRRLAAGQSLSRITAEVASAFGIGARILPMSDQPVPTFVSTLDGEIGFQDYFVRLRCAPELLGVRFGDAHLAERSPGVREALTDPELSAILIAPSNPYLSIDPILAIPGMKALIRSSGAPVVAVTPIIGGEAVKGPTAKIMRELGVAPSPLAVAEHYGDLIDGFLLDERDSDLDGKFNVPVRTADTLMRDLEDRKRVAREALAFCAELGRGVRR